MREQRRSPHRQWPTSTARTANTPASAPAAAGEATLPAPTGRHYRQRGCRSGERVRPTATSAETITSVRCCCRWCFANGAKEPIVPVENLANEVVELVRQMPAVVQRVALLFRRHRQQLEERPLRGFERRLKITRAVDHQRRR